MAFIYASVGMAAIIIIVMAIVTFTREKKKRKQLECEASVEEEHPFQSVFEPTQDNQSGTRDKEDYDLFLFG
jgi:hypothetical protein